jgi:uncharacterized protein YjbJ (UPF0337 family)
VNKGQIKGVVKEAAGKVQREIGEVMGRAGQQANGATKEAEGKAEKNSAMHGNRWRCALQAPPPLYSADQDGLHLGARLLWSGIILRRRRSEGGAGRNGGPSGGRSKGEREAVCETHFSRLWLCPWLLASQCHLHPARAPNTWEQLSRTGSQPSTVAT